MPKCPKCGEEIDHLNLKSIDGGEMSLSEDGEDGEFQIDWNSDIYGEETLDTSASCPECGEKLFDDYEEASDFLRGN